MRYVSSRHTHVVLEIADFVALIYNTLGRQNGLHGMSAKDSRMVSFRATVHMAESAPPPTATSDTSPLKISAEAIDPGPRPITPIFRWAGSKRKIISTLAAYWKPSYSRYVEPFAGSAAIFFSVHPARALLGDINADLIEAYNVIRERPDDVHKAVSNMKRSAEEYYRVRDDSSARLKAFGRAVRFVYLNRYCFNGIYRTNQAGRFNVPFANKKPGVIPPIENFRRSANLLQLATLKAGDFGAVLSSVRRNDFVYLDPPYAVESRRVFRQYDRREFCKRDLDRLGEHLKNIDHVGAYFVASYADCREARDVFRHWTIRRIRVRRNIAGFVADRRIATELLVTNI